jgi:hypothetical protein
MTLGSAAVVVAPPHLGVMPLGDIGAGIRTVTPQRVIPGDLIRAQQRRCREMPREMDETKLRPGGLSRNDQGAQAVVVEIAWRNASVGSCASCLAR